MKLSSHDILRIVGIIAGLGSVVTGQVVNQILTAFYVPAPYITITISVIGGLITLATLVNVIISKAVPDGFNTVITPSATPQAETLTTKSEVVATSKAALP